MDYYAFKSILVFVALLTAMGIFGWKVYKLLWDNLRRGQPSGAFSNLGERLRSVVVYMGAQKRLFKVFIPGTAHFFIFWGFILLSLTIFMAIVEGLLAFLSPHLTIPVLGTFGPLALVQDILAVCVIVAVLIDLYIRVIVDPERYKGSHKREGVLVLLFIFTIMVTLLVNNGARINLGEDPVAAWRPVSSWVGSIYEGLPEIGQIAIGETAFWIHLGVVLIFLTMLPGGKHFHVITSLPAIYLRDLEPKGRLPEVTEFNGNVGVSAVEQFRWRQLFDFYTCTECGRCQDVCPAYSSGANLSPKMLMMDLRDNLMERGDAYRTRSNGGAANQILERGLIGDAIKEETLWACTTCLACDDECPLLIEHVTPIVDMRRYLVIEGRMDEMLQDALSNLGRYGNSFGQSERARAKWTRVVEPQVIDARRESVEYLWFVGDYASYNASCVEVTQKTAEVFNHVDLDFGIMYEDERNSGNDVRRVGEEGLFEMLMEDNLESIERCRYQTLLTTDPHSYNTLRNEYGLGGNGSSDVLHYSELFDLLIQSGRLSFSRMLPYRATYHDPCYLGRYNGVYDAPRRVIRATGCELIEMKNHRDRAICCGAGGGRIWMDEDHELSRPSEKRILEAMEITDVDCFIVACPKDVTMYKDAVKTTGVEGQIVVKDLAELILEAL